MARLQSIVDRLALLVFADGARPIEWASFVGLVTWVLILVRDPEFLRRDVYAGFSDLPPAGWLVVFGLALGVQIIGLASPRRMWGARILALGLACGLWTVTAANFVLVGISTTATGIYAAFALQCFAGTLYVAAYAGD